MVQMKIPLFHPYKRPSAEAVLNGDVKGFKRILPFLGPAFIAAVAYIDPGNFATNITAGSEYGYLYYGLLSSLI